MISKDPDLPDGPVLGVGPVRRRQRRVPRRAPQPRVRAGDAPRGLRRPRRAHDHRRRDARRDDRGRATVHRPGTRRARHGVPVRARQRRPGRRQVGSTAARPARPQGDARALAGRAGRRRVEQPVLVQPRPAAHRVALGRRRRAPGALGDDAGHRPPPPPRHAVRVPGRGARHDERGLHVDRGVPRHRGPQPLRVGRRAGPRSGGGAGGDGADAPRQRPHPDAVGRLAARRVHDRHAVDRGQPEPRGDQRRRGARRRRRRCSTTTAG